jgi:hypothetical protein
MIGAREVDYPLTQLRASSSTQSCGFTFSVPFGQCGLKAESETGAFSSIFEYRTIE